MPIGRTTSDTPTAATRAAGEVRPRVLTAWQQAVNIAKAPLATTFCLNTFSFGAVGKHKVTVDGGNNTVILTAFNPATGIPRHLIDPYAALPTKESGASTEVGGLTVQSGDIKATFEPEPAEQVSLTNNVIVDMADILLGSDKNDRTGLGTMVSTPGKSGTSGDSLT